MKCEICGNESDGKFCENHSLAFTQLCDKFDLWTKALGVGWEAYLHRIASNPNTGRWAKEVADHLLKRVVPKTLIRTSSGEGEIYPRSARQ